MTGLSPSSSDGAPPRVLLAKTALDGHWRGVTAVARVLRDAGFEVLLAGMARADEIAHIASDEDVDLVGLNVGGRIEVVERIVGELQKARPGTPVFAGGTLSPKAIKRLGEIGVECFPPGSSLADIVQAAARLCGWSRTRDGGEHPAPEPDARS